MSFDELRRDLEEHVAIETRDNIERGMTPEAARAAALRKFGNVTRIAEDTWSVWRWMWLDRLLQDARYAWRALGRNPAFAAVAILTLALGIGMNTAVFSVVNAVLLRPLPYPDAGRLVWVAEYNERFKFEAVPAADYFDWKARARSFESLTPYTYFNAPLGFGAEADQVGSVAAPAEFLKITGARPLIGRLFTESDRNVILLSHNLYARRFGSDPNVVGRPVTYNGRPFTVCGVLPESYRFALPLEFPGLDIREIEAYIPEDLPSASQVRRGGPMAIFSVVGKLLPGVRMSQASAELESIQAEIVRQPSPMVNMFKVRVMPLGERLVGGSRRALAVLLGAVAFVLLIACANIANLMLSRATSRQREIAIRAAIGAGRGRMIAQLLAEGILLSLAGGAAGLLLARVALQAMVRVWSHAVPRLGETTLDGRVLGFTLLVSIAT
jgi:predicted permease